MDWIFDNFQILALILIAFASWIKTRMSAKEAEEQDSEETYDEKEVFGPDSSWEQAPQAPRVPPPLIWKTPPAILTQEASFEAAREAEAALKHQQDLAERLRQIRQTKATTSGGAAATRARVAAAKAPKNATTNPIAKTLRIRLQDKGELRRAFIMKEILESPISQR